MRNTTNTLYIRLLMLCLLLPCPGGVLSQTTPGKPADKNVEKLRQIEEFVRREMEKDKIPGLTIGFQQGETSWVKGFGYADLENKLPAKTDSTYRFHERWTNPHHVAPR